MEVAAANLDWVIFLDPRLGLDELGCTRLLYWAGYTQAGSCVCEDDDPRPCFLALSLDTEGKLADPDPGLEILSSVLSILFTNLFLNFCLEDCGDWSLG